MRNYIILTEAQADLIRGGYGKRPDGTYQAAIEPVELPDGKYAIPEVCAYSELLKEAHEKVRNLKKVCEVQDIKDLPEDGNIEKDKYYLSKEYWVVKAKKSVSFKKMAGKKLSEYKDDILIREDIRLNVDSDIILLK